MCANERERTMQRMEQERDRLLSDVITFSLIALFIVLPIRLFVAQPFVVKGASMEPTFDDGEYLIVDQLSYRFQDPARGDVIIMRYPKDPAVFFIKRIIGLPGETVTINGTSVSIQKPDGTSMVLPEPYLEASRIAPQQFSMTLTQDQYFVMGDNRRESSDSRIWGPLPKEDVVGHAVVRLLPVARAAVLPGAASESQ